MPALIRSSWMSPVRRRVLGRIGQEVGHDLGEAGLVAPHHHRIGRQAQLEPVLAFFQQRAGLLDRALHHIAQVDVLQAERHQPARDARDVQHVRQQPVHVLDLAADDVAGIARPVAVDVGHLQQLGGGADGRERVAQFVPEHGRELVLGAVFLLGHVARMLFALEQGLALVARALARGLGAAQFAARLAQRGQQAVDLDDARGPHGHGLAAAQRADGFAYRGDGGSVVVHEPGGNDGGAGQRGHEGQGRIAPCRWHIGSQRRRRRADGHQPARARCPAEAREGARAAAHRQAKRAGTQGTRAGGGRGSGGQQRRRGILADGLSAARARRDQLAAAVDQVDLPVARQAGLRQHAAEMVAAEAGRDDVALRAGCGRQGRRP
nr:hypothetical protein [Massilia sp. Se16.2.3]